MKTNQILDFMSTLWIHDQLENHIIRVRANWIGKYHDLAYFRNKVYKAQIKYFLTNLQRFNSILLT